jgi:hypothetical protein
MNKFGIIICLLTLLLQGCNSPSDKAQAQQNNTPTVEKTVSTETPTPTPPPDNSGKPDEIIIDSRLTLAEALGNQNIPERIKKKLDLVELEYYAPDGKLHRGQVVIDKSLKADLVKIFQQLKDAKFPIAKMIPVSHYDFSDDQSMADNNTSAFNYRVIEGTNRLSNHALGRAIDLNPLFNPFIKNGETKPANAKYDPTIPGTITKNGLVVKIFKKHGWKWGGNWRSLKDYQHFEK